MIQVGGILEWHRYLLDSHSKCNTGMLRSYDGNTL